jgi:filamentous hemagglutinin family protein
MKRHASMNRIYRLIWSRVLDAWIVVAENAHGRRKDTARKLVAAALALTTVFAQASPTGGQVTAGAGSIAQTGNITTITQSTPNLSLSWKSFNIAPAETTNFVQPSAAAVAVNRISDINGTQILGHLNANGQIYLINPNGILFGQGSQVTVGGLVASTLNMSDASLNSTSRNFAGPGTGNIVNQGTINGNYVALIGNTVSNQGVINAQLGSVALGAGNAVTLTFNGNNLVNMQVEGSVLNSLAENGGLIQADGGYVIMSAGAKDALLASVVNNTGVIEARTVQNQNGTIMLLGGMTTGTVNAGGTLDASAPGSGNGGFVETSAAHVKVANDAIVTTAAANGKYGTWLIDPVDYTVAASGGDMMGSTLSTNLGLGNVTIQSSSGTSPVTGDSTGAGGNININDPVSWGANTTISLIASNNINVNANVTATGNTAGMVISPATANGTEIANPNGQINLGLSTVITLSGSNPTFQAMGMSFTVINNLGAAADATTAPVIPSLQGVAAASNLAGNFALGSNIDATSTNTWNAGAGFKPIGNSTTAYTGVFVGLGHTISNLYINRPGSNYVGLFGIIGPNSNVFDVGLINNTISGGTAGTILPGSSIGGLVGNNQGSVDQSYATGTVTGTNIYSVGGLVGHNQGYVSNSYASGSVNGSFNVGGLVGKNSSQISNSFYNIDQVSINGVQHVLRAAGIYDAQYLDWITHNETLNIANYAATLPYNSLGNYYGVGSIQSMKDMLGFSETGNNVFHQFQLSNSIDLSSAPGFYIPYFSGGFNGNNYTVSNLNLNLPTTDYVGLFGMLQGSVNNLGVVNATVIGQSSVGGLAGASYNYIGYSYSTGSVTGTVNGAPGLKLPGFEVGGLVGQNGGMNNYTGGGNINNSYSTASVTGGYYVGGLVGANYATLNNTYATGSVTGSAGSTGIGGLAGDNAIPAAILPAVIPAYSITNSYATGAVASGTNSVDVGGLIGLSNNPITNINATGNVTSGAGSSYVGGLVGGSTANISFGYATGNVSSDATSLYLGGLIGRQDGGMENNVYATGNVSGGTYVGGLAGLGNSASFVGVYATGNVSGVSAVGGLLGHNNYGAVGSAYATGSVSGTSGVGGLLGNNYGQVSNAFATGSVSGATDVGGLVGYSNNFGNIGTTYATGSVTGTTHVGGLIGWQYAGGQLANSYWNMQTTGQTVAVGLDSGTTTATAGIATTLLMQTASSFPAFVFTSTPGATGNNWVIVDTDGTLNNAGGAAGSTYPMLAAEYSTTLNNMHQLQLMAMAPGATYTLNQNLNAAPTGNSTDVWAGAGFAPVGNAITPFTGTFNGAGHTINNLYINQPTDVYVGLFGGVGAGGQVNNVGLLNDSVSGGANGVLALSTGVGALAGANLGTINNSYASGTVTGGTSVYSVGGLVGHNQGSISNSYAMGNVNGSYNVGGLVGYINDGTLSNSFYNIDQLLINGGHLLAAGGLYDAQYQDWSTHGESLNIANYASLPSLGAGYYGVSSLQSLQDMLGFAENPGYSFRLTNNIDLSSAPGLFIPYFNTVFDGNNNTLANLLINTPHINDVGMFGLLLGTVNNLGVVNASVTGQSNVGGLAGINYGNINNSYVTGSVTGVIQGSPGFKMPGSAVGGLVGENGNQNGYMGGSIYNSYSTANVAGGQFVGGLVGVNIAPINNSYATGAVTGNLGATGIGGLAGQTFNAPGNPISGNISNSYATGNVTSGAGSVDVGGLLGLNSSTINSSYSTGSVSSGAGSSAVGGLVGASSGAVNNSFWDTLTSGQATSAGGTGMSTADMQAQVNFTMPTTANGNVNPFWDFSNTWVMYDGHTDPLLRVFMTPLTVLANNAVKTYDGQVYNGSAGVTYSVTPNANLLGALSYSSGVNAGGYTITLSGLYSNQQGYIVNYLNGSLLINQRPVDLSGSRIYDGSTSVAASIFTMGNLVAGESLTLAGAGSVASKNVSAGAQTVSTLGLVLGSTGTGLSTNYTFSGGTQTASFTPLALTGSISPGSSTYGATLNPGTATLNNVVSGDTVTPLMYAVNTSGNLSGSLNLKAGSYTGIESIATATGSDAGNYNFAGIVGDYTVNKLALTGSISTGTSVYGAMLNSGTASFNNAISGDAVSAGTVTVTPDVTSSSGHLTAGTHAGVESVGGGLTGSDAGNYTFAGVVGDYTVAPLALTGSISVGSSTYGSPLSTGLATLNNVVGIDTVTPLTYVVNTSGNTSSSGNLKAGSYTGIESIASATGSDAGNYTFAGIVGDYTVNKLTLTGSIGPGSSTYGSPLSTGTATLNNVVSGDTVTPLMYAVNTSGNLSTSNNLKAGSYTGIESIATATGSDAGNYNFAGIVGDYTVNKLALTGSISTGTSVYGAMLNPGTASFNNAISGDAVTPLTYAVNTAGNLSGSSNLKAGSYTGIESIATATGGDAGNYTYAGIVGDYTVNKLALTGSISAGSSTFGTTLASGTATLTNVVSGDVVTPLTYAVNTSGNLSGSLNLKAGSYTGVESIATATGADAGNYTYTGILGGYTVSPLALTVVATGTNKIYDGTLIDVATLGSTGVITGDLVSFTSTSANFADKNVGVAKPVSVAGISASGSDAANYTVNVTASTTATITAATLSYLATPASFVAGQTPSPLTGVVNGFVAGDNLASSTTGALAWNTTAGTGSSPGLYPIDGSGLLATNYIFTQNPGNAAALTLTAATPPASGGENAPTGTLTSLLSGPPTGPGFSSTILFLPTSSTGAGGEGEGSSGENDTINMGTTGLILDVVDGGVRLPDNN